MPTPPSARRNVNWQPHDYRPVVCVAPLRLARSRTDAAADPRAALDAPTGKENATVKWGWTDRYFAFLNTKWGVLFSIALFVFFYWLMGFAPQ